MSDSVSYELDGRVAVITVDNPPVNATGHAVREGLAAAVARFATDDAAGIAVILGAGRLFIGGADVSEFGKPRRDPSLPEVIDAIEASPKPVLAAIHGTALGGGLEVALGCHYRLAMPGTSLGLPEVTLGILPGAGGTQRLPRLVGTDVALDMITSGKPVPAETALKLGLIDAMGEGGDVRAAGLAQARKLLDEGAGPRPVRDMDRPAPPEGGFEQRAEALARAHRGEVAQIHALRAVQAATEHDIDAGLAEERRLFLELMDTPQRAGLIHAFFAERRVTKLPELKGVAPREIASVGVIGGGTMGAGIATAALLRGLPVTLIERDAAAADKARATIDKNLDGAVKRGKLSAEARESARLDTVTDYAALGQADLIVEAVFESMEVKTEVFRQLDAVARSGAILATNTSYLDVDEIARATSRPGDVIGLHFFSPAHVMRLLEVVVADRTAPEVTSTAFALAKRLGKTPVRAGVCDGFIGNRMLSHYRAAADRMVMQGASPYAIDRALVDYGFAMGPFAVADLAGLDIGFMTRQRKGPQPGQVNPDWADALYHKQRLGRKTGRGFYIYDEEAPKGRADAEVEEIIAQVRADHGVSPRDFADEEIVARYMAAMINEGARVVEEGIAQRPSDVDVVLLSGYGFPRYRGGPMHQADATGLPALLERLRGYAASDDPTFWQPAPLLERLVAEDRNFDSLNG